MKLQDRVAVVTGAATGIGQAIAIAFAQAGASVVVDYVGEATAADETIAKINAVGGKSLALRADVSNPDDVNALVQKTVATCRSQLRIARGVTPTRKSSTTIDR